MEDNGRERLILLVFPDRTAGYLVTLVSAGISVAAQTEAAEADLLGAGGRRATREETALRLGPFARVSRFPGEIVYRCLDPYVTGLPYIRRARPLGQRIRS